jgi:hypothetical protein
MAGVAMATKRPLARSLRVTELDRRPSTFQQKVVTSLNLSDSGPAPATQPRDWIDVAVYILLIAMGAMQLILCCRATDIVPDATYFELAKSIAHGAPYGFNFKPETMLPPGFPYLLALLIVTLGSNFVALVRTMAISTTLALIFVYELLRERQNRGVAAAICFLLASTPLVFVYSTRLLSSDMPYFFTSMCLLWALMRLDSIREGFSKTLASWIGCLILLLSSVLLRSTGIALLTGILAWQAISIIKDRSSARRRVLIFLPLLILGMGVQISWMHWAVKHQFSEWPIHGYQDNYLTQLRIKNGNNPEMGMATWKDVVVRPIYNADDRATELWTLLSRKSIVSEWYSPTTTVPLVLVLLGLGLSFWETGGSIAEWYFLSYEAMYLFWPWDFEERFLLPVLPLAFLYMWRGAVVFVRLAKNKPRPTANVTILFAAVGIASTLLWGRQVLHPRASLCIAIWTVVAAASALLYFARPDQIANMWARARKQISLGGRPLPAWQIAAAAAVLCLFLLGMKTEFRMGIENLRYRLDTSEFYPDIEAARWIRDNSAPSAIVMARKEDMVYHYGDRRVIWFPPSTDAQLLMDGIRRYHVQYVITVDGNDNYWSPPAARCFDSLLSAYPASFALVHQTSSARVYAVQENVADRLSAVRQEPTHFRQGSGSTGPMPMPMPMRNSPLVRREFLSKRG